MFLVLYETNKSSLKKNLFHPRAVRICLRENVTSLRFVCLSRQKKKRGGGGGGWWLHAHAANDHRVDQRAGQTSFRIFRPTAPMQGWTRLMFPFCSFPSLSLSRSFLVAVCIRAILSSLLPPSLTCFPRAEEGGGSLQFTFSDVLTRIFRGIVAGWRGMAAKFEGKIPESRMKYSPWVDCVSMDVFRVIGRCSGDRRRGNLHPVSGRPRRSRVTS